MEAPLSIGQLARAAGVTDKTIRFYEQIGVLPAARRSASGYRQYSRSDADRLVFKAAKPPKVAEVVKADLPTRNLFLAGWFLD